MGASVRGAIDLVRLGTRASARLRGEPEPAPGDATFADAAIAALSGRLRLDEGCEQTAEAIVLELIERLQPGRASEPEPPGKAAAPRPRGRGGSLAERRRGARGRPRARPPDARRATSSPARTRSSSRSRPRSAGSTSRPSTTSCAPTPTPRSRCSPTSRAATDPQLRAQARRLAARLFVRSGRLGAGHHPRLPAAEPRAGRGEGDLDLDLTLEVARRAAAPRRPADRPPLDGAAPRAVPARRSQRLDARPRRRTGGDGDRRGRAHPHRAREHERDRLRRRRARAAGQGESRPPAALVDDLLSLRGKGRTDLALALRTAARELGARAGRRAARDRALRLPRDGRRRPAGGARGARSRRRPGHQLTTRTRSPRAGARGTRARTLPAGDALFGASSRSTGAAGLKEACRHLDEWWLDAASHLGIRSPALGV